MLEQLRHRDRPSLSIFVLLSILLLGILLVGSPSHLSAQLQEESKPIYRVETYGSGGYAFRLNPPVVPQGLTYNDGGFGGIFRAMWRPEHLLSVGLEIGYLHVADVLTTPPPGPLPGGGPFISGSITLSATPIFLVFAMQKYGIDIGAGIGLYSLSVSGNQASGIPVESDGNEIGYMFLVGYTLPITRRLGVGAEVQLLEFTDRPIGLLVPQIRVRWILLEY
jgi:hypothetical protein